MSARNAVPLQEHLDDASDEWGFLGALVASPQAVIELLGSDADPALFSATATRLIFEAAVVLLDRNAELSVITLTDELRVSGHLEAVGGAAAVTRLATEFECGPSTAAAYLDRMRHKAALHRLAEFGARLADAGGHWGNDPAALAAEMLHEAERIQALQHTVARKPKVEFFSPSQLRAFTVPEGWNLVGDHHVQRGSPFVIGGAPGVGKSRAATALAVAGAMGAPWFGLPVHQPFKTMILQAENGPLRLKDEYADLDSPAIDAAVRICPPPPFGFRFEDPQFCRELLAAIAAFGPDVFIIDPWNRATSDDKSKGYLETFNRLLALLPTGDKAPALGIVAHTRKPAAGERTNGRGLLNVLAGGYALGSVPRAAFVIQHASDDPEEKRVVFTCAKNNDGELGPRSAWVRGNGLFQPVVEFDWKEFDHPDDKRRAVTEQDLEAVFSDGRGGWKTLTRNEAVTALMEHTELSKSPCYSVLNPTGKFQHRLKEKQAGFTLR